jgi:TonB family protein
MERMKQKKSIQNIERVFSRPQNWRAMTVCTPSVNFAKMLMFAVLSFVLTAGKAQKANNEIDTNKYICILIIEPNPEFIGGPKAMFQFLSENITYPKTARHVEGTVYTGFVVNKDGSLTDVKVKRGVHPDIDSEAVRVVKLMSGKWKAGIQNGKPARVAFTLPIKFRLESESGPTAPKQDTMTQPIECAMTMPKQDADGVFVGAVEQSPEFLGGTKALMKFITDSLQYPKALQQNTMQGTVYVGFIVETDGQLTQINVKRGIGGGCNEEAIRLVNLMQGKWKAGKQSGKPVRVAYTIPIKFKLD